MSNLSEINETDLLAELAAIRKARKEAKKKRFNSSKLDAYHRELVDRANDGASIADLKAWLEGKGVQASRTTIWLNLQQANPTRLDPYQHALAILSDQGASITDLRAWLEGKGVQATQSAIWVAVRRWQLKHKEPHFLSPNWKPAKTSAGSGEPASRNGTTPSSGRHQ